LINVVGEYSPFGSGQGNARVTKEKENEVTMPKYRIVPKKIHHTDDPDTSREGAESISTYAESLRQRIHSLLQQKGPMSAEQIADALDVTHLQAMKRLSDLKNLNLIRDTNLRVPTRSGRRQIVWEAV
jgi:predicted HTH transcriptional regulator